MEANLEIKPSITNVESGQNCKAKINFSWLCNEVCDVFNRLIMILYSLHIFLY